MFEATHTELEASSPSGLSRPRLESAIEELSRVESHAAERRLAFTAAIDDLDDGGLNAETVTRSRTKRSKRASEKAAKTAKALRNMPKTKAALADGRITEEHADAAADAAERVSPAEADDALAADAALQPADRFAKQSRSWANAREREEEIEARQQRRWVARVARTWTNADGMLCLYGEFDPVAGAAVKKAFDRETNRLWHHDGGRDGTPDEIRTRDQRGADAIAGLLTREPATQPAKPPHPKHVLMVRVDVDRLRADGPSGTAELVDGTPLPQATLERIACGADLIGMIYGADGSVLWQGRRVRTATDDQWLALVARDGGCAICSADPAYCEAHHIDPWAPPTNGRTDIDRMALVCTSDHHLIHEQGYTLARVEGSWQLIRPGRGEKTSRAPADEAA